METKNIQLLTFVTLFFIGLVTLFLSYFEESVIGLAYQLISLVLLSVSVVSIFIIFNIGNKDNVKVVSVSQPKTSVKPEKKPKIEIVEKSKDEDFFKKNIVSIDLEEDEDLTDDEKKVIDALKDNDGSMQQKDVTYSVFKRNKVKAHRVISSLIKKDQIIKRNEGKTNKIFLK